MGDFSKKLLGIFLGISLSLGVGVSLSNSVHREAVGVEAAETAKTELVFGYSDKGTTWNLTNADDKGTYWLCPSGDNIKQSIATFAGIFTDKTIVSDVVVTINNATYGNGSDPSSSTFSLYSDTACTSEIATTQSGSLASSNNYKDTIYTIKYANISTLKDDLAIKIVKPGKQIRLSKVTISFTEDLSTVVSNISLSPSTETTIGIGYSQEFTVAIKGTNLTKEETVTADYIGLTENAVKMYNSSDEEVANGTAFKNGEKIILKALALEEEYGELSITSVENSSLTASVTIKTEESTPTIETITLDPVPTDDAISIQVKETQSYKVTFTGKYLSEDTSLALTYEEETLTDSNGIELSVSSVKNGGTFTITGVNAGGCGYLYINGDNEVAGEYAMYEVTTIATVVPTKLDITKASTFKEEYIVGESFDSTGLALKVTYNDESVVDVTSKVEWSLGKFESVGTQSVTASYSEVTFDGEKTVTASISVNVIADYINEVAFDVSNAKTEYNIGDTFVVSETGVTATGSFVVDKTVKKLTATDFTYSIDGTTIDGQQLTISGNQTVVATYTYGEKSFSEKYTINITTLELKHLVSEGDDKFHLVTDVSSLEVGDKIVLACNSTSDNDNTKGVIASDFKAKSSTTYYDYLSCTDVSFSSDKSFISTDTLPDDALILTLESGSSDGIWKLVNNGRTLAASKAKSMLWSTKNNEWTISVAIDNDGINNALITSTTAKDSNNPTSISYNYSSPRFLNYKASMSSKGTQIYKLDEAKYDTHSASWNLINFVNTVYDETNPLLACDPQGINSSIKWDDIKTAFNAANLDTTEIDFLKTADSDKEGNIIEQFLYDYDYIVNKYEKTGDDNFLSREITNPSSNIINRNNKNNSNSTILIVMMISLFGITSIGSYFFIKKRKYN